MKVKKLVAGVLSLCVVGGATAMPLCSAGAIVAPVASAGVVVLVEKAKIDAELSGVAGSRSLDYNPLTYDLSLDLGVPYKLNGVWYADIMGFKGNPKSVQITPGFYNTASKHMIYFRKIADNAFKDCTSLESVDFKRGVKEIGNSAFKGCTKLKSIDIPDSVTSIGRSAFCGCSSLAMVNIPSSVTSIGDYAFWGTPWLNSQSSLVIVGGVVVSGKNCSGDITIPRDVTWVAPHAFEGCTGITSVKFDNPYTTIGESAFKGCTGLKSVTLPYWNKKIESSVFAGCTSLTSVKFPNEGCFKEIGAWAFEGVGLTEIEIPALTELVGDGAFYGCSRLEAVVFRTPYCKIWDTDRTIPDNATIYAPDVADSKPKAYATKWGKKFKGIQYYYNK